LSRHSPRFVVSARGPCGLAVVGCLAAAGCQHHRANQYAYAPPLAPPVYPQPQAGGGPVVFPAPPGMPPPTQPVMMPGGPVPPAPAVAGPVAGPVAPQSFVVPDGQPCPPCHDGGMPVGAVYYDEGQSPPCP
jgi:hypothetical protein